jgi:hypothetical protein
MVAPKVADVVAMILTPILPLVPVANAAWEMLREFSVAWAHGAIARPARPTDVAGSLSGPSRSTKIGSLAGLSRSDGSRSLAAAWSRTLAGLGSGSRTRGQCRCNVACARSLCNPAWSAARIIIQEGGSRASCQCATSQSVTRTDGSGRWSASAGVAASRRKIEEILQFAR